jgi:hypothetical protein
MICADSNARLRGRLLKAQLSVGCDQPGRHKCRCANKGQSSIGSLPRIAMAAPSEPLTGEMFVGRRVIKDFLDESTGRMA